MQKYEKTHFQLLFVGIQIEIFNKSWRFSITGGNFKSLAENFKLAQNLMKMSSTLTLFTPHHPLKRSWSVVRLKIPKNVALNRLPIDFHSMRLVISNWRHEVPCESLNVAYNQARRETSSLIALSLDSCFNSIKIYPFRGFSQELSLKRTQTNYWKVLVIKLQLSNTARESSTKRKHKATK